MVLPRGLAPRTSAFAKRRAELLHLGSYELNESKTLRHAGAAPAPGSPTRRQPLFPSSSSAVWKTAVLAVTPMTLLKVVAASGIAPDSPRLRRGANLSQLRSRGPSARYRAAVYRLSADCSAFELRRTKWSPDEVMLPGLPDVGRLFCF